MIGATGNDAYCGNVCVYKQSEANGWIQIGGDTNEADSVGFGYSVSLSDDGNTVAVGGYDLANDSGNGNIYKQSEANVWMKVGIAINEADAEFNVSLLGDGTIVTISNIAYNDFQGQVGVYQYEDTNVWNKFGVAIDWEVVGDLNGFSVSLEGLQKCSNWRIFLGLCSYFCKHSCDGNANFSAQCKAKPIYNLIKKCISIKNSNTHSK